jgi:hypothetical protein
MRPRVQWALFCRGVGTDERGRTTLSDLVHVLAAEPADVQLWLVASIAGAPNEDVSVSLCLARSNAPPVTLPAQVLRFGADGFAELKTRLPPFSLASTGTFSVDVRFANDQPPAERVAVTIAAAAGRG